MKKLYILRHAKAGNKGTKKILDDHERPLSKKGLDSCKLIAKHLKKHKEKPALAISSTAKRTRKTFENVFKDYPPPPEVEFTPRLYLAGADDIISVINEVEDSIKSLMVIGHNPGLHELCLELAGGGDKALIRAVQEYFPPGSLAVYEIDEESWEDVGSKSGKLVEFTTPKNLTPGVD